MKILSSRRGFTLVEVMIALAILCIVLPTLYFTVRSFTTIFNDSMNQLTEQQNINMTTSSISNLVRNTTNIDLISYPFTQDHGYRYIYLDPSTNTVKFSTVDQNGNMNPTPGAYTNIAPVNNLSFNLINDADTGNYYLDFTISGTLNSQFYTNTSEVLLNNITITSISPTSNNNSNVSVVRYTSP